MTGAPAGTVPTFAGVPADPVPVHSLTSTMTRQPDQGGESGGSGGSEDVLWLIGGGMLVGVKNVLRHRHSLGRGPDSMVVEQRDVVMSHAE